jgi:crotonobetainyl-CoA:carnitine CoA-transferase CaiB-like acyl-CoA transferase
MLSPYRVIDLTDERGQLCGQLLGDLGAEVILVEPPDGSAARRMAPFAEDTADPERSLWFWAYNRGKKSVVADLETGPGRTTVLELVRGADFLIESFPPGYLDRLGLGWEALRAVNPRLVMVSITPFGQTGPRSNWAASDLTVVASSGVLQMTGDHDRPPVRIVLPQAFLHAGAEAAAAATLAHAARERDGLGQHIDISAQTATMMATQSYSLSHAWRDTPIDRFAGGLRLGPITLKFIQPAKDGWVSVTFLFGSAIGPFSRRLMEVMCERGFVDEATRDKDWLNYTGLIASGQEPLSELERCIEAVGAFTAAHTKQELFELAFTHRLLIVPVSTVEDLLDSPQLKARDFWVDVEHPDERRTLRYPGPFAKFSKTPLRPTSRAPRLGEHTGSIAARPARAPAPAPREPRELPLAGVKVADFAWVMAGPAGSRYLADFGATQVKIESTAKIDTARTLSPMFEGVPGPERSGLFANVNAGKLGLTLNLSVPEGRELALRLVRWADVVTESYTPRAMRSWGLDYASLRKVKPDLIMLSSCLGGQSGPWCELAGFGSMGAQLAGFGELAGWPDSIPAGPFGAYTDYVAPKFTAMAIAAALDHRRRTGEGQYIDLSQAECSQHFLTPAFLDLQVNARVATRAGNASSNFAPHAVFPCAGDDRWVAVVAETEEQWRALCLALDEPDWATDPAFATLTARLANRERLEARIAGWTRERSQDEVEQVLQAHGVPAYRSATSEDLHADPQIAHRGHFITADHAGVGPVTIENARAVLSGTPPRITRAGPVYGQDNEFVLRELLGLTEEEVVEYAAAGALE